MRFWMLGLLVAMFVAGVTFPAPDWYVGKKICFRDSEDTAPCKPNEYLTVTAISADGFTGTLQWPPDHDPPIPGQIKLKPESP